MPYFDDDELEGLTPLERFRAAQQRRGERALAKWENTCLGIRPDQYLDDGDRQFSVHRGHMSRRRNQ